MCITIIIIITIDMMLMMNDVLLQAVEEVPCLGRGLFLCEGGARQGCLEYIACLLCACQGCIRCVHRVELLVKTYCYEYRSYYYPSCCSTVLPLDTTCSFTTSR